jgi:GNAT superfamily N-acetyltransferase
MTIEPSGTIIIRRARDGEDVALTELVLRSVQRTWGYSDEFMAWEPDAIVITPTHISDMITNVLEIDGLVAGLYVLRGDAPSMELSRMMIDPEMTRLGLGRLLWEHAVETARRLGVRELTLDADPNAEPFYQRMGAVSIGQQDWSPPMMPDWHVKIMKYQIS